LRLPHAAGCRISLPLSLPGSDRGRCAHGRTAKKEHLLTGKDLAALMVKNAQSCCSAAIRDLLRRRLPPTHHRVSAAAKALGVRASDLRTMSRRVPALVDAALEAVERALDEAESIVLEGLPSESPSARMSSAAYLVALSAARRRAGAKADRPKTPKPRPLNRMAR
jgi:hypothetical protein